MRMWMVDPKFLCNKHLLGEHGEIHKHRHIFEKQYSISGRIYPQVQIQPSAMQLRHDELVLEMQRRNMRHQSPYKQPDVSYLPDHEKFAVVDITESLIDLKDRCVNCHNRIVGEK